MTSPASGRPARSPMCCAAFANDDVAHVEGSVDTIRDAETVETELMLTDLESLERRAALMVKRARGGDRDARILLEVVDPVRGVA
jgi:ribosome-binding ATPase